MKKFYRLVSLLLIALTLCVSFSAVASAASNRVTITNPTGGRSVDASASLKVKIRISGEKPSFQEIAFRDLTTGKKYIMNQNFKGSSFTIKKSFLTAGHKYRVWVATYGAEGEKLAQDIVEFTAKQVLYACPFRNDYKAKNYAELYRHCMAKGCFKDVPWIKAAWEGGWCLIDAGLNNPLYSVIIDMVK